MELEEAIRTRRTHKVYGPEPVPRATLADLFELARWAPNHRLTNPWRFRVVGPATLAALQEAAGPEAGAKLLRAPTLVAVSCVRSDDPLRFEEDLLATGCAAYAVLLGAHARGLAGYWRTPALLHEDAGRAVLEIGPDEHGVGLLHLGAPRQEPRVPEREPAADVTRWLD